MFSSTCSVAKGLTARRMRLSQSIPQAKVIAETKEKKNAERFTSNAVSSGRVQAHVF